MPDPTEATEQVQTAPEPIEPAPTSTPAREDVLTSIADAHASGAPPKEIERLEALLEQPAAPTEAKAEEAPAPTPEATIEEAKPETETETPASEQPPVSEEEGKAPRVRIHDPLDQAFHSLRKAGKTPEEAYRAVYGETAAPEIPATPQPAPALQAIDAEIASHEAALTKIKDDRKAYIAEPSVFAEELAELDGKRDEALAAIAKASGKRASVEFQESQRSSAQQVSEQKREEEFTAARKVYQDLNDAETPLYLLTAQLSHKWRTAGDPRADDIHACAGEAAKRLNLKPVTKAEPAASPVAQATPVAKPPGPAVGSRASMPVAPVKTAAEIVAESEGRAMAAALGEKYVPGRSYEIPVEVR